ncbi:MAG TPA: RloB family protein [Streptosporangiaceae bacterium]|nr:RloB family protein [Streptosporangiaceae bacterium]
MSRRDRKAGARPLKRKVATRQPRKTLVVFCEGERTEPEYLEALKRQPSVRDVAAVDLRVETGQGGSVPRTLTTMAAEARSRALEEDAEIDEFWCVFDVEWPRNHPGLRDAVHYARANSIQLAVSNPCFELWLILHFQDHAAWLDNTQARRLRRQLDGSTDKGLAAVKYMPLSADARRRAASLETRHLRDGTAFPHDNPSSGMHRLLAAVAPPSK